MVHNREKEGRLELNNYGPHKAIDMDQDWRDQDMNITTIMEEDWHKNGAWFKTNWTHRHLNQLENMHEVLT